MAERLAAASVLRHPVGTPADGAIGLQSSVPLVRGTFARRPGVGPDRVHQEPRPAAERRGVRQVHDEAFEPSAGQTAVVGCLIGGGMYWSPAFALHACCDFWFRQAFLPVRASASLSIAISVRRARRRAGPAFHSPPGIAAN